MLVAKLRLVPAGWHLRGLLRGYAHYTPLVLIGFAIIKY